MGPLSAAVCQPSKWLKSSAERLSGNSLRGSDRAFLGSARCPKWCPFAPFRRLVRPFNGAYSEFPETVSGRSILGTSRGRRSEKFGLAPGAPAPQEDDPARREAQLHPLGASPALLPARVGANLRVEPDAWALRL